MTLPLFKELRFVLSLLFIPLIFLIALVLPWRTEEDEFVAPEPTEDEDQKSVAPTISSPRELVA